MPPHKDPTPVRCAKTHVSLLRVQLPLTYPFVEAFRLSMLAMSHKHFPFPVLGAVLARNSTQLLRAIQVDDLLTYT